MQIEKITLPNLSRLIRDYKNHDTYMMQYFDYLPFADSFDERIRDLKSRSFQRDALADALMEQNKEWGAPEQTLVNIDRLRDEDSVVVIGGQQAGLLTGPLYTVNKAISLIQLARKQERELGIPVIPVFWIAGEDHDFDEVNHVFMPGTDRTNLKKHKLGHHIYEKRSVSHIPKDEISAKAWLDGVFGALPETFRTKELYHEVLNSLESSHTYTDFFARLMYQLFPDEGIVLVDSADRSIRLLESDYFVQMIQHRREIAEQVHLTRERLLQAGYAVALDTSPDDGNLFLQYAGERTLLQISGNGTWAGKQNECSLAETELLEIAKLQPERLSNNVVTRPLMQELLFPTLAFVGGNGEIAYWSAFKEAFHVLGLKMPPVLPRLSFTFSDAKLDKVLAQLALSHEEAILGGTEAKKAHWLATQMEPPLDKLFESVQASIIKTHEPLRELAAGIRDDIRQLAERNIRRIEQEINFLHSKMVQAVEDKYANRLAGFDYAGARLKPFGGLQERVWNPLELINRHGGSFISTLAAETCSFKEDHYIVHI